MWQEFLPVMVSGEQGSLSLGQGEGQEKEWPGLGLDAGA